MGLLSMIFGLPLAPVRGVIALARVIQERAEQELNDPSALRRDLEQLEEARATGEVSDEEVAEAEQRIVGRLGGGDQR